MIARNDPPNSLQMLVLVLERRSRDSCDPCRQVTPSGSLQCDRYSAIVAVVYLGLFILEGSPKELLNKRR